MFHLGAFAESIDPGNAMAFIAAVREQTFSVDGDDFRVPATLPFLVGVAALINDASGARAQFQSPSLRVLAELDVEPIVLAAAFGSPPEVHMFPDNPLQLVPAENLNLQELSDPAAAALHYGLIWLADGPIGAVGGNIFSVRATATVAQDTVTWVNGNLEFGTDLPAGTYQVVGARCVSTDGVAARFVFPEQTARPGIPVVGAIGDLDDPTFRNGKIGVFGQFEHTNPPTVDILGGAAAAQTFIIDLIKVG